SGMHVIPFARTDALPADVGDIQGPVVRSADDTVRVVDRLRVAWLTRGWCRDRRNERPEKRAILARVLVDRAKGVLAQYCVGNKEISFVETPHRSNQATAARRHEGAKILPGLRIKALDRTV